MTPSDPTREALTEALGPKRAPSTGRHAAHNAGWNDCRDFVLRTLAALPTTPAPSLDAAWVAAFGRGPTSPFTAPSLDVERLARAMWSALTDRGVLRIDADSPKEVGDIAEAIAREYARSDE